MKFYVVTNHKFINSFAGWQNETVSRAKITVLDDGSTEEQNRKGCYWGYCICNRKNEYR